MGNNQMVSMARDRAFVLNASAAWGVCDDGQLLLAMADRIEELAAELAARDGEIADWLDAVAGNLVPQQEKALRMAADNLRLGAYQMQKTV